MSEPRLEWLNYHHLLYFYTVAKEGSVSRAAKLLRLAQPTLSGQIRKLEHAFDEKLFERRGRTLALTEVGRVVYRYAEEIFAVGGELMDALRGRPTRRSPRLLVGVANAVPKLVVHRLLSASHLLQHGHQVVIREGSQEEILAGLAAQGFDLVISDAPLTSQIKVRAFNHRLGESSATFFAAPALARRHRGRFPGCLDGAPMLLPTDNSALRRALEKWFQEVGVRPRVVAEIEDSALLKVFGQHGAGLFAAPTVVANEVKRQYGVHAIFEARDVTESFYAITAERRIKHPAAIAIAEAARERLFA